MPVNAPDGALQGSYKLGQIGGLTHCRTTSGGYPVRPNRSHAGWHSGPLCATMLQTMPGQRLQLLIYGANGYTGKLIAACAAAQGLTPIVAGRNGPEIEAIAASLGLEARIFSLSEPPALSAALSGVHCVLNAAGPFSATARPMIEACLAHGSHYLDITGEIDVFEMAANLDPQAKDAGIMLLPGVGFDVAASDCLAASVARQVPDPLHLHLGILSTGRPSQGTAKTAAESLDAPTRVRRNGSIVKKPPGTVSRTFDFGRGPRRTVAVSWGDVATAYHSTGIPNVTVYFPARRYARLLRLSRLLGGVLASRPLQALIKRLVELQPEGPDAEALEHGVAVVVAEVENAQGTISRDRLTTPNSYKFTYLAAVEAARRVLDGQWRAGFQTPSLAYGPSFAFTLPDCHLEPRE